MTVLFADDTSLFCTVKIFSDIASEMNIEIHKIYSWVKAQNYPWISKSLFHVIQS